MINRSKEILNTLESTNKKLINLPIVNREETLQNDKKKSISNEVFDMLLSLNTDEITPKQALNILDETVKNLISIQSLINSKLLELEEKNRIPKIIAVSKTFKIDHILPLIQYGHSDFGENKVQEAIEKWTDIKNQNKNIRLHLIGKLQTNKVKFAVKIFDYIHSLDNEKLAKKIAEEQINKM